MAGIGGKARETPDAPAFLSLAGVTTFAELDARQRSLAGYLRSLGLERGHRIAILTKNRVEAIETATGALRAGIVPVMINALLTRPEIDYILEDSAAGVLFTDRLEEIPSGLERVVTFGPAYERCLTEAPAAQIDDHLLSRPMHYTSGTTGLPKGVYVEPLAPQEAARHSERFRSMWDLRSDDVHLVCSPLAHSAPMRIAARTLEAGGSVIAPDHFDAEQTLATIALFHVTSTFMVPTHMERLIALGRKVHARYDLSSMRLLVHAGAPVSQETKRSVIGLFPRGSVWEFYGSTEGQATRISTEEWLRKPGSVGQPHPGARVYIMDDNFNKVPSGATGQVWVLDEAAEPWQYWDDSAKTERAWRDGAFSVGDLGWLDDEGYLYLTGRSDDTIITGGVNVYPREVEAVLAGHPAIAEVVVFGAPDAEWGQQVCAHVVPAEGTTIETDAIRSWARERLASFKCPRSIEIVAALEHTPTGKVKRPRPA